MKFARLRNYLFIPAFLTLMVFNYACGVEEGEKLALDFDDPVTVSFLENGKTNPTEIPINGQVEIRLKNTLENSGVLNLNSYMYKTLAFLSTSVDDEFQIMPEASGNSVYSKVTHALPSLTSTEKELEAANFIDNYREFVHEDGKYKMVLSGHGEFTLAMAPITIHGTAIGANKINIDGTIQEISLANIEDLIRIQASAASKEENGELSVVLNTPAIANQDDENKDKENITTLPGGPSAPGIHPGNTNEASLPASGGCSMTAANGLNQAWILILGLLPLFQARLRK